MTTVGVIPARYDSSRLPGKPLKDICGKPMIQHVYERVLASSLISQVIVATDDQRIVDAVEGFGGTAMMTSSHHQSGTSRSAEIVEDIDVDVVINIQGDEPLIKTQMIDELATVMLADAALDSATLCYRIPEQLYSDPNVVKVVMDLNGFALYFSRSLIPFGRNPGVQRVYEHIGVYAYTRTFLRTLNELEDTPLSTTESLEQLKILEHGYRMKVIESRYSYEALSVDTKEDLDRVRNIVAGGLKT